MNSETRVCQNCKIQFTIEPDDLNFYERLKVPPPTFCFACRTQRKYPFRNERTLYKAKCVLCGTEMFSMYPPDTKYTVYCNPCWWSDKWDSTTYGREYDFAKPFFEQFFELQKAVPRHSFWHVNSDTSPFANFVRDGKNSYLSYSVVVAEEVYYSKNVDRSTNIYDSLDVNDCSWCFENNKGEKNYNSAYCESCEGCIDSKFLYRCFNCRNCFLCSNLRNGEYCILNKKYSKDEYREKMKELNTGSYASLQRMFTQFEDLKRRSIHRFANMTNCVDSTGNDLDNAKDAKSVFSSYNLEHVKYGMRTYGQKDSMDISNIYLSELMYDSISGGTKESSLLRFSMHGFSGLHDSYYIDSCASSANLFGCVGMRNKKFCILNKQYSEEEYRTLVAKITTHMDEMPYTDKRRRIYRFGEFFPIELSPFAYNETIAQEYFPLTREEAEREKYPWKDMIEKSYSVSIKPEDLADDIKDAGDTIANEIIGCEHAGKCNEQCTTAFKVIPQELQMYRKFNMPVPRLCPNCRHYRRLSKRTPWKLWHRRCMCDYVVYNNSAKHRHHLEGKCPNEFETSYAPEHPEIVYCEQCYQAEVS